MAKSRQTRIDEALGKAKAAVDDLEEISSEYAEWRDGMPDNLQDGPTYERLDAVIDSLDMAAGSITDAVGEVEGLDLPLGFGRD